MGHEAYDRRMAESRRSADVVDQQPRFGPLRSVPPADVVASLTGAVAGTTWVASRVGDDGDYPNGGIWKVTAEHQRSAGPSAALVKRTGGAFLGGSPVWAHRLDPSDPQWWGREAQFYMSSLASSGWPADARAARGQVDEHDGCADLWLEEVHSIPAGLDVCRVAVAGLAHWQLAHREANESWLATNWIATHVSRQAVENEQTLGHPAWHSLIERGLNPGLRDWVKTRVMTSADVSGQLAALPQMLTHHDFHEHNIGTVDGEVVIIDWAYVGWGPVGHDVGHLALSLAQSGGVDLADAWALLEQEYCDALSHAGWSGDLQVVRRSMRVSNQLRMGWVIDYLLVHADQLPDQLVCTVSADLSWLYDRT